MENEFKTLTHQLKYKNPWMEVYEDTFLRPSGNQGIYGVVEKKEFSLIIPADFEKQIVYMVEQYRYPLKERTLEFPQGMAEAEDASYLESARRELQEETGLFAQNIRELGTIFSAVGFSNQKGHVFLATNLSETKRHLDLEEEDLVCRAVSFSELYDLIKNNSIKDAGTLAAVTLLQTVHSLVQPG
ncbi:MAG: NUDIX hydrolase [Spirochaetia bacterium]|nr:NUDIX hydrolase [Spirochaetia bacterium]